MCWIFDYKQLWCNSLPQTEKTPQTILWIVLHINKWVTNFLDRKLFLIIILHQYIIFKTKKKSYLLSFNAKHIILVSFCCPSYNKYKNPTHPPVLIPIIWTLIINTQSSIWVALQGTGCCNYTCLLWKAGRIKHLWCCICGCTLKHMKVTTNTLLLLIHHILTLST